MEFDLDGEYIIDVYKDGHAPALGTQLFEVFAIKLNINCQVYGKIQVRDGKRNLCYYDRQPDDIESIAQDAALSLSGPHRPSSANRYIEVSLDLKDSNGDEFIKESFSLLCLNSEEEANNTTDELIDQLFDKYLFKQVVGKSASASIYYTLSRVAAQAEFEVLFTDDDENGENNGHDHVDVYGTIVTRYGNNYNTSVNDDVKQHCKFLLFGKTVMEDKVHVEYKKAIPLLRSYVAVPRFTSVVVEFNLEIIHSNGLRDQLKEFQVKFDACEQLGETKTFKLLNHGSMVLDICWWHCFGSLYSTGAAYD